MKPIYQPLDWEGTFSARLKPLLEPGDWGLRFGVVDSRLYQRSEDEISVTRVTWDLVKRFVHPHLEKTTVNLSPPVEQIRKLIPLSGGKLRYLTSSNRTSVGLMQINFRVWRGIYRPENLRWNIQYNARAGAEILKLYLRRYSLKRFGPKNLLDEDLLAQAVYAMYNGGPDQFDLFLKRVQQDRLQKSDRLFMEKYEWVEKSQWDKLGVCLTGKET
jgi:hypothetical protein